MEAIEKKISHCFTYSDFHQHLHSHHFHDHKDSHSSLTDELDNDPFSQLKVNEPLSSISLSPVSPDSLAPSSSVNNLSDALKLGEKEHLSVLSKDLPKLREHLFDAHQPEDHEDHYISKAAKVKFNSISSLLKKNSLLFSDFNHELDSMKKALELKLSKSFLTNIENILENLKDYDVFQKRITEKVTTNEIVLNKNCQEINNHSTNIEDMKTLLDNLLINTKKFSTKKEIHLLANEINQQNEKLKTFTNIKLFNTLEKNFLLLEKDFNMLELDYSQSVKSIRSLQDEIPTKATLLELQNYFKKEDYIKDRSFLMTEINSKSPFVYAENIDKNAIDLAKLQIEDREAIDILLTFLQWYLSRGQHLEHNLSIIDKHLKDLVSSRKAQRVHSVRLPNGGIQFSPVKPSITAEAARVEAKAGLSQANYEAMKGFISFSEKL